MVKTHFSFCGIIALLLSCSTAEGPDAAAPQGRTITTADGGTIQTGAWLIPDTVRGISPENSLGVPTFSGVMNQDSEIVTQDALLGHFSVLWFYPFANTSG